MWQDEHLVLQIFHPVLENIQKSLINLDRLERNDLFNLLVYFAGSILGQEVKELPLKTELGELSYFLIDNPQ